MIKIYLILLFLFLGLAILAFFYDLIADHQIWKSQVGLKLKTPIIVFTIVLIFAVFLIMGIQFSKKQKKAEKEFAHSQGWIFIESRNDPQGLIKGLGDRLEKVCPEKIFYFDKCIMVESGRRSIILFECRYRVRDWGSKGRHGFACLIESDRFRAVSSQVNISFRNPTDKILLSHQVDMGDSEFSRNFIVTSKDPSQAKKALNESSQAVLLESARGSLNYDEINIGPGGAVILTGPYKPFEEWLLLVNLARQIESTFE